MVSEEASGTSGSASACSTCTLLNNLTPLSLFTQLRLAFSGLSAVSKGFTVSDSRSATVTMVIEARLYPRTVQSKDQVSEGPCKIKQNNPWASYCGILHQ